MNKELCWIKRVDTHVAGRVQMTFLGTGETHCAYTYLRSYPTSLSWYKDTKYELANEWLCASSNTSVRVRLKIGNINY